MLRRQKGQVPSVPPNQETPTREPFNPGRAGTPVPPISDMESMSPAMTSPTIWCPGIIRGLRGGSSPSTMCRSVRQTPQARTRSRTWPGLSSGVGTPSMWSGDSEIGALIFWGPPGTGKTTLAQIIAHMTRAEFIEFSAVLSGIKEIKQVMADAERARQYGTRTTVFVDEIHRFNKAQQDAFLPHVEKGNIRLIGATTENPSFEIISALLSRSRVYVLKPLTEEQILLLLRRALTDAERGLGEMKLTASDEVLKQIAAYSSGDARSAYNVLEVAAALVKSRESSSDQSGNQLTHPPKRTGMGGVPAVQKISENEITSEIVRDALQKRILLYDKAGEEHYNLI